MSAPLRVSKRKNKGKNKYLETLLKEENDALVITNKDNKNIKIDRGYTVYCNVCNTTDDNYDELTDPFGDMIQCDRCDTWQHINCILKNQNEPIEKFFLDNDQYICNQCDPMRYPHLLSPKIKNTMITFHNDTENDQDYSYAYDDNSPITKDENKNKANINKTKNSTTSSTTNINKKELSEKNQERKQSVENPKILNNASNRLRENASKMFIKLFKDYIIPETVEHNEYNLPKNITIEERAQEMGELLEKFLFDYVNERKPIMINKKLYSEKVRIIYSNVKDVKNLKLKCHIMNGELSLEDLVKLNSSQLINPDLQSFKKKIDSKVMDQVVFEVPSDKPVYVKTHKGEELMERYSSDSNFKDGGNDTYISLENDFIVKNHTVRVYSDDDDDDANTRDFNNKENKIDKINSIKKNIFCLRVNIKIPEILSPPSLINNAIYLSCSNKKLRHPYNECLLNGNLMMEGRLTTSKAYAYLNEVKSSRNILAYYLKDYSVDNYTELVDWMLLNDKVLGLKCSKIYIKNIYLIASDSGEYPSIINELFPDQGFSDLIKYSEPKLFLLVVIKPELIP